MKKQAKAAKSDKKRRKARESEGESSDESTYNIDENDEVSKKVHDHSAQKKAKLTHHTTELIAEISTEAGLRRVLRVLLDTVLVQQ